MATTHPSNLTLIDGAVFEDPYEGALRRRTAADWLDLYAHNTKAQTAIRGARDGEETSFRAAGGVVWHLQRAVE